MVMTSRAARSTSLASTRTGEAAPGSYNVIRASNPQPHYTGFSNSEPRQLTVSDKRASKTPGPGSYLSLSQSDSKQQAVAPTLSSTAPRLAPSYTGSTAYAPSTVKDNPGPGTYSHHSVVDTAIRNGARAKAVSEGKAKNSSVSTSAASTSFPARYNPPAVPDKHQTYGYTVSADGVLPVGPPPSFVSGVKGDTVGPGAYNVIPGPTTGPTPSNFSHSKTRRALFESTKTIDNWIVDTSFPGPGYYEASGGDWNRGGSSAFKSGVKMAHQVTAPDEPVVEAGVEGPVANFGRAGSRGRPVRKREMVQSFGTTAVRDTVPRVHSDAVPHQSRTSEFEARRVGPGSYDDTSSFKLRQRKTLRAEPVGFDSSEERPCLRRGGSERSLSAPSPGPMETHSEYQTIAFNASKARLASRPVGVFGTTGPRFRPKNDIEVRADPEDFNVGPGSYEGERVRKVRTKPAFTSSFRSGNPRFEPRVADVRDGAAGFVVEGRVTGGALGGSGLEVKGPAGGGTTYPNPRGGTLRSEFERPHAEEPRKPAFGRSEPRGGDGRNIDGNKFTETPGPKYVSKVFDLAKPKRHLVHGGRERESGATTFGKGAREFATGSSGPQSLGPGAYNLPSSIDTQSFNVTLKAKRRIYGRKPRVERPEVSLEEETLQVAGSI